MPFENLFVRTKKSIGGIQLDAVLSEGHSNKVRITKNPVELGADIADHAVIEPAKINILAEVSDTPLGTAAFGQIVDTVTGLFGTSTEPNITRSNAAYNAMLILQKAREPLEIQTKLRLYQNMLITSINTVQDVDTSRIVRMSIDLEEVFITESEVIALTPEQLAEGKNRQQASTAEKKGRVEPTTPSENVNKSVLKTVIDWVGE